MKAQKNPRSIALALLCVSLLSSINLSAKDQGRDIQIAWYDQDEKLAVIKDGEPIDEPYSYHFELSKDDKVIIYMEALWGETKKLQIEYTITGVDVNARFSKRAAEVFPIASGREAAETKKEIVPVTDDLLPGGLLTITFKKILPNDEEETKIVKFRIKDEYPWFFSSVGMIVTNAKDPEVAIVKTNKAITFEKDGEIQQAYEQIIVLKDNNNRFRPLQSVVSFLNFRVYNPIYISLGFSLNQKIFDEPMIGLSYYCKVKNVGLVATFGAHFSNEVEIISMSGFKENQSIDPTLGLTVEDIPKEEKYHTRLFFGFSLRF